MLVLAESEAALVVSTGATTVLSTGATTAVSTVVVESVEVADSELLLQAVKAPAMATIANNFFIVLGGFVFTNLAAKVKAQAKKPNCTC